MTLVELIGDKNTLPPDDLFGQEAIQSVAALLLDKNGKRL